MTDPMVGGGPSWEIGPRYSGDFPGFCRLLDRLPSGAYLCDAEGLITYFNDQAVALWGRAPRLNNSADRYCGSFRLYSSDGSAIRHEECWMALALRNRVEHNRREIVIERPDGTRCIALAHANPIFGDDGTLLGAVNVLIDITEHRRKEAERREMHTTMAHMGRLTLAGELAAGMAHELNQPLTAIINYAEACREMVRKGGAETDELAATLEHLSKQGQRAGAIIQRLREFTRRTAPKRTRWAVNQLVRSAVDFMAFETRSSGVVVHCNIRDDLPEVFVDGIQIQQVLLNLLRNSMDAMERLPPGEHVVWVRAFRLDSGPVCVSVLDQGPGIDSHVRDQLFFPFVTTKAEGMGLGLAISKSIIEAHDGKLWLDAGNESGACFCFSLPVTGEEAGSAVAS